MAAFWVVSLLLVITPGADWAYAISAGLRGRSKVAPAVSGLALGAILATLAVAAGVGAVVAEHPMVLTVITGLGAGYLLWLGISMLLRPSEAGVAQGQTGDTPWHWLAKGAFVSGMNPKQLLLLLALLPQFVQHTAQWPVNVQIVVLGVLHAASCAVVYMGVGLGSRHVLGARPTAAQWVSRLSGVLMVGIAIMLLAERILQTAPVV
ncbi:LysE family translocator [Comamonas sp. NoAH]|uniref:LysE family translocator n=1 Tax=Comamonas halotolerans TaxID=3041496 RepID=UPI0024E132A7|nr:LysE family translocator [Comamonas sp. NoAH]